MRIACLQFDPQLKQIVDNQRRAERLLASQQFAPGDLDLILLPEMAFSGYCFADRAEILPFAEEAYHGPTATWCGRIARELGCFVACGFPEKGELEMGMKRRLRGLSHEPTALFNSLLVVNRSGHVVHVYRKHFLYTTDETWAREGPGFECRLIHGLGRCSFGICMDVNPKQFQAPFDRFEFASALFAPPLGHHEQPDPVRHRLQADLILLCNNWLRAAGDLGLTDAEHCRHLLNYWAARLRPVLGQPAVLALANRVGLERGTRFAGCSCVMDLKSRTVLGHLNGVNEGVLVGEI